MHALRLTTATALIIAGFALIAALLMPNPGTAAAARPAAAAPTSAPLAGEPAPHPTPLPAATYTGPYSAADDQLIAAAATLIPAYGNGDQIRELAGNVCDGLADGTPEQTIAATLDAQGWTLGAEATLISAARAAYCPNL